MHPKKTFYVWKCAHCEHRNKEVFNFHYEFPHRYNATWSCSKCGSENYVDLCFRVYPIKGKHDKAYYDRWSEM
jgi:hypothetical protein